MQPHEPARAGNIPTAKSSASRYVVSLIVLLVIVGGIAWLVQYLPSSDKKPTPSAPRPIKKLLDFPETLARWRDPSKQDSPDAIKEVAYKECEFNSKGHYDFLFKNAFDEDIEIVFFWKDCDCTNLRAAELPRDDYERLNKLQREKPSEPLPYAQEPAWVELHGIARGDAATPPKEKILRVKVGEAGVIRVAWVAKKAPGLDLKLAPLVWFQPIGDVVRREGMPLFVPVRIRPPLEFLPTRASAGLLTPGTSSKVEFRAWSATRDSLDLDLITVPPDPLFAVNVRRLTKEQCAALETQLAVAKLDTRVRSACAITVTVQESNKDGKKLDQGSFYQKLHVKLDGVLEPELSGLEITGRIKGDIEIGGTSDMGKIRFAPFDAKYGASKSVYLSADAKIQLEKHSQKPDWIDVALKRETKEPSDGRHLWLLEVTVKAGTADAQSFDDRHAVVLRIVGPEDRFVRIPLEGQIGGSR